VNLGDGDLVMDVARVVNEEKEPLPITVAEGEVQEVVDSTALEEEIGIEGDETDESGEEDLPPLDELEDELEDDEEGGDEADIFHGER
jgi:hypothetical protein